MLSRQCVCGYVFRVRLPVLLLPCRTLGNFVQQTTSEASPGARPPPCQQRSGAARREKRLRTLALCKPVEHFWRELDTMRHRGQQVTERDVGMLIWGLVQRNDLPNASAVLERMRQEGVVPGHYCYSVLMSAYAKGGDVPSVMNLIDRMHADRLAPNHVSYGIVLNALARAEEYDEMRETFAQIRTLGLTPNSVHYCTMINGLLKEGNTMEAVQLVDEMRRQGVARCTDVYNPFIGHYMRQGDVAGAHVILEQMKTDHVWPDRVTYQLLLRGYVQNRVMGDTSSILQEMQRRGFNPDASLLTTLFDGCISVANVWQALHVLCVMRRYHIQRTTKMFEQLIKKLVAQGFIDHAKDALLQMRVDGLPPTTEACNTVLQGLGNGEDMVTLLQLMKSEGAPPNTRTYTCMIKWFANSPTGDALYAERLLCEMRDEWGLRPTSSLYSLVIGSLFAHGQDGRAMIRLADMVGEEYGGRLHSFLDTCVRDKDCDTAKVVMMDLWEEEKGWMWRTR